MASIKDLQKDFKKLAEQAGLAHSYIFFGHESTSERLLFARALANYLESKKFEETERVLIDAHILDAREAGGIDLIRSASQFLWQKPVASKKRTLIIDRADHLTIPAQNSILKISEEPPAHALIILLVKNYDVLLPAVQSRFQKIYLHGETQSKLSDSKFIGTFLKATDAKRREILKELVEDKKKTEQFVTDLIIELRRDKIKNWRTIKELLGRWTLINQFNVNKKLQLEAALWKRLSD